MASSRTGKVIDNVKFYKSHVTINFSDKSKLEISHETYTSFYFYDGKTLSSKEIKEIKKMDELNKHLPYAMKIVTQSLITENRLKDKLYKRQCSKATIEDIIKLLKSNDLINDDGFIQDYLEYSNEKLIGELKVKQELYLKGVSKEKIDRLRFSRTNELKKAKALVKLLNKRYQDKSYEYKKQHVYTTLHSKGFVSDIALQALTELKQDKDDRLLDNEVKTSLEHWMKANETKFENPNQLKQALMRYLKGKGYPYNNILKAWRQYYEFND